MTKLILADDHLIVRQGLKALLQAEPDFDIVGECGDGIEALELVEQLKPDVLIVDLLMPRLNGLEVTRKVLARFPQTLVIVLSMRASEAYVLEAMRSGASGYVLKSADAGDLVRAVRVARRGGRYLSPPLSEKAIDAYIQKARDTAENPYETLTARERQILQLAAEGLTNAEIGAHLSISPTTVMTHRGSLMRKLGLHNQTELVRFALQHDIVPLEE